MFAMLDKLQAIDLQSKSKIYRANSIIKLQATTFCQFV